MLFVPGGWASNKLKNLGSKGINEIKKFVNNGGNYLGFCGGAGLATLDGMGLLNVKRKPTKERVPSFSGRIHLNINEHPIWKYLEQSAVSPQLSAVSKLIPNPQSLIPIFNAWWPSQFLIEDSGLKILAAYGNALPDSFSSDLNVGDVETNSNWTELEEIYGINLNPNRLKDEPAVIEGTFGKGKVILSLIHFDTPDDANGAVVLKNLWDYLGVAGRDVGEDTCQSVIASKAPQSHEIATGSSIPRNDTSPIHRFTNSPIINALESAVNDLISLGIRNFLWFWKNPMLLQWRRGVRGLEYCTLYVMVKELKEALSPQPSALSQKHSAPYELSAVSRRLHKIKGMLMPFTEKAKHLLILERHAIQNGHITYERCDDPAIQKIRIELFGDSKSHGGLFKKLIDETDKFLYALIKMEAEGQRKHCPSSHS
jgi:hypothetical protein